MGKRWWKLGFGLPVALLVGAQLVPYGRAHTNPPITSEPSWPDPTVRALAVRACFDCHSNETKWPWYSSVAPASWLLQFDVTEGRRHLNFSEWDRAQKDAKEAPDEVLEGEMPMALYTWIHREGALTANERDALVVGLRQTLGKESAGVSPKTRGALERWLAQADAELRFRITQNAVARW